MKVKNIHSNRTFSRIFNIIKWLPVLFIMVLVLIFINKKPVETDPIVEVSTSEDTEISTLVETEDSTELEAAESNTEEFESITESGSEESYAEETEYSTELALAENSAEEATYASQPDGSSFWIKYIDVGQGDSALLQCDGRYMLIDGGDNKKSSLIYTVLKNEGVNKLDYIIATHPDADHIGGISGALNYSKVDICFCPVTSYDTDTFNNMIKYLAKQDKDITVPMAGDEFDFGSARVKILGPVTEGSESNNNSIVAMVQYGNNKFLFTGDAEEEEEYSVLAKWEDLKCDVLKVGHHGSSSSTSSMFLTYCKPEYAVISVGQGNSYGHPTQETLAKLSSINTTIYRTDLQGDITLTSDGTNIKFTCEKKVDANLLAIAPGIEEEPANADNNAIVNQTMDTSEYVLNTNTKKFHYPTCSSVGDMSPKNRQYVTLGRDDIIAQGYVPCKRCNP